MNFLEATVRNVKELHDKILNTPRGRMTAEKRGEIMEFIDYCDWLFRGGEITKEYHDKIVNQIKAVDFENFAEQRRQLKKQIK